MYCTLQKKISVLNQLKYREHVFMLACNVLFRNVDFEVYHKSVALPITDITTSLYSKQKKSCYMFL